MDTPQLPLSRDGRRVLGYSPLPHSTESYNISKIAKEILEKRKKGWKESHPFGRPQFPKRGK
jgi:hypothetical protein